MNAEEISKKLKTRVSNDCVLKFYETPLSIVEIDKDKVLEVIRELIEKNGPFEYIFDSMFCMHPQNNTESDETSVLITYFFRQKNMKDVVGIRLQSGIGEELKSISSRIPNARTDEEEVEELFGIKFKGYEQTKGQRLPKSWNGHPLRKNYEFAENFNEIEHFREPGTKEHRKI